MKDNLFENSSLCALTEEYAFEISQWEYAPPYDVYNFKGHPNGYLFDRSVWGTEQFCLVKDNAVIGQVACQRDGDNLWVGWSLNPKLCGGGNGSLFVKKCVSELCKIKNHNGSIVLRVAVSNQRAVKAYQKAGFEYAETILDEIAYTNRMEDFWVMKSGNSMTSKIAEDGKYHVCKRHE